MLSCKTCSHTLDLEDHKRVRTQHESSEFWRWAHVDIDLCLKKRNLKGESRMRYQLQQGKMEGMHNNSVKGIRATPALSWPPTPHSLRVHRESSWGSDGFMWRTRRFKEETDVVGTLHLGKGGAWRPGRLSEPSSVMLALPEKWTRHPKETTLSLHTESESESCSVKLNFWRTHGQYSPWNSPGQNIGVGSRFLLQGIFPTQGLNPGLPHCRQIFLPAEPSGRPSAIDKIQGKNFKTRDS